MNKPNFFLIGAPKCGTTTVSNWLSQHNQVFMSPNKEPHYFYSPYNKKITLNEYLELFVEADADKHKAIGEASVWYLFNEPCLKDILEFQKNAKFIICIRNPIEMVQSLHNHKIFTGFEKLKNIDDAWEDSINRENGTSKKVMNLEYGDLTHMSYRSACSLGTQLSKATNIIKKENLHICVLDDLASKPKEEYYKILNFLDVDTYDIKSYIPLNKAKKHKSNMIQALFKHISENKSKIGIKKPTNKFSWLIRMNTKEVVKPKLSKESKKKLLEHFSPEIEILEKILNRDFSSWKS